MTAPSVADAADHAVAAIGELGGATVGDKTILDAAVPFAAALRRATAADPAQPDAAPDMAQGWRRAVEAATQAAARTAEMSARRGRARTHGDASLGHPDPGATSFALLMEAAGRALLAGSGAPGPGADRYGKGDQES